MDNETNKELKKVFNENIKEKDDEALQMRWCLDCGKMVTNEYIKCPSCDYTFPKIEEDNTLTDELEEDIEKETEILTLIKELKISAASHLKMKEYNDSIVKAEEVIALARPLDLQSIIKEQEDFIDNILSLKDQKDGISKILNEFKTLNEKYEDLLDHNKIIDAHSLLSGFLEKYTADINFSSIPSIRNLMLKDAELWRDFNETQDRLERQLDQLEIDYNDIIIANDIHRAEDYLNLAKVLLIDTVNKDYQKRWDIIENAISKVREDLNNRVEIIKDLEIVLEDSLRRKQFDVALNDVKRIIETAENIGEIKIAEKYKDINGKIRNILFEFKSKIKTLSLDGTSALQNIEVLKALEKYKEIKSQVINFEIKTEGI